MRVTAPLRVGKGLVTGWNIYASLSHRGVLAVCADRRALQLTDLGADRQARVWVERVSIAAFYDDMLLLLTFGSPLREAAVEAVFERPTVGAFGGVEGTGSATPRTDVSLLHARRVLYYPTTSGGLMSFDVDTRASAEVRVGRRVHALASLTGLDCGAWAVFQGADDRSVWTLGMDGAATEVRGRVHKTLTTLLPSAASTRGIRDAVLKCGRSFVRGGARVDAGRLVGLDGWHSVVRVYRDVLLVYDRGAGAWALVRVRVP